MSGENSERYKQLLEATKKAIGLSGSTFDEARNRWEDDRESYYRGNAIDSGKGIESANDIAQLKQLRLRHQLVSRLRDEVQNLDGYYNETSDEDCDDKHIIYALDQSTIQTYAQYNDEKRYDNFEFFYNEFSRDKKQRRAYMLSLYSTIFRSGPMVLLEADRSLLLDALVYFHNQTSATEGAALFGQVERLRDVINDLESAQAADTENSNNSKILDDAFDRLIDSQSFSEVYQELVPARIQNAMAMGDKQNTFMALQQKQDEMIKCATDNGDAIEIKRKWRDFWSLMRDLEQDGLFASNFRIDVERAVELYDKSTSFSNDENGCPIGELRPNQAKKLIDLVIEVHTANACLEKCGIKCEIQYISPSRYIYDFLHGLGKKINLPLVHPRMFASYRHLEEYKDIRRVLDVSFSVSSGLATIIKNDNAITISELEAIEKNATRLKLLAFRNYAAFKINTDEILINIANSIRKTIVALHAKSESEDVAAIAVSAEKLVSFFENKEIDGQQNYNELEECATRSFREQSEYSSDPYEIFAELAETPDERSIPKIAVRVVKSNGEIKRLICLPVRGSYRYMFGIANSSMALNEAILAEYKITSTFNTVNINVFLKAILKCIEASNNNSPGSLVEAKDLALSYFARAIHSASFREWKLTDHLCDLALEKLDAEEEHIDSLDAGDDRFHRFYMLRGETHYLKHMALRGLAEKTWRGLSKFKRLNIATQELKRSATAFNAAYSDRNILPSKNEEYPTKFGVMTFRIPMAFIGIIFEVLVLQKELGQSLSVQPPKANKRAPFADLGTKDNPYWGLGYLETMSLYDVWENPETSIEELIASLKKLDKISEAMGYKAEQESDPDVVDGALWAFRRMRVLSMISMLYLSATIGFIQSGKLKIEPSELCRKLDRALDDYEDFLLICNLDEINSNITTEETGEITTYTASPFSQILLATLDAFSAPNSYSKIANYFAILDYEARLDASGLPRRVARNIREHLVKGRDSENGMIEVLEREIKRMREDFSHHD